MKLSAPKMITWIIAVVLGVVGIVAMLLNLFAFAPWLVVLAWLVLAVATAVEGL